jgi:hypothetical protein
MGFRVEKQTVVLAASREIARIEDLRKVAKEDAIKALMGRKWFSLSRQRAEQKVNGMEGYYGPYWDTLWPSATDKPESMLAACAIVVGDWIELTQEEAALVATWLKAASIR